MSADRTCQFCVRRRNDTDTENQPLFVSVWKMCCSIQRLFTTNCVTRIHTYICSELRLSLSCGWWQGGCTFGQLLSSAAAREGERQSIIFVTQNLWVSWNKSSALSGLLKVPTSQPFRCLRAWLAAARPDFFRRPPNHHPASQSQPEWAIASQEKLDLTLD